MDTIQVKVISEQALAHLKFNSKQAKELFTSNRDNGNWIYTALRDLDAPIFEDKPYRIPDFKLYTVIGAMIMTLSIRMGLFYIMH